MVAATRTDGRPDTGRKVVRVLLVLLAVGAVVGFGGRWLWGLFLALHGLH